MGLGGRRGGVDCFEEVEAVIDGSGEGQFYKETVGDIDDQDS